MVHTKMLVWWQEKRLYGCFMDVCTNNDIFAKKGVAFEVDLNHQTIVFAHWLFHLSRAQKLFFPNLMFFHSICKLQVCTKTGGRKFPSYFVKFEMIQYLWSTNNLNGCILRFKCVIFPLQGERQSKLLKVQQRWWICWLWRGLWKPALSFKQPLQNYTFAPSFITTAAKLFQTCSTGDIQDLWHPVHSVGKWWKVCPPLFKVRATWIPSPLPYLPPHTLFPLSSWVLRYMYCAGLRLSIVLLSWLSSHLFYLPDLACWILCTPSRLLPLSLTLFGWISLFSSASLVLTFIHFWQHFDNPVCVWVLPLGSNLFLCWAIASYFMLTEF